jgi:tRNA A37 threonylcarbamoyladenosine synthetase subunit TsaC/SUA5/YrdC
LHAVRQRDARKNYIGLVSDTTEDKHLADNAARWQPRVMSYLIGRLAAVLKRARKASPGRTIEP